MTIEVVPYSENWPAMFDRVAADLSQALADVPGVAIEHVGSTSVPGLAAKPILDIDILVESQDVPAAVSALVTLGYEHRGDLGVTGREDMKAPDEEPRRNVYVCEMGTLNVRNHLAVGNVLRRRDDLRDEYSAVKLALAADTQVDIDSFHFARRGSVQQDAAVADHTDPARCPRRSARLTAACGLCLRLRVQRRRCTEHGPGDRAGPPRGPRMVVDAPELPGWLTEVLTKWSARQPKRWPGSAGNRPAQP